MIVRRAEMKVEKKDKLRDGEGTVTFTHYLAPNTEKNARLLAELILPPGASIGYHPHEKETEYFIVHSGSGTANDNGTETAVQAGDVLAAGNGAFHGIKNTGAVPLVMTALIVTY
jgi:mannose-6-phosphate isomerase-like protein (cupin superfamily)